MRKKQRKDKLTPQQLLDKVAEQVSRRRKLLTAISLDDKMARIVLNNLDGLTYNPPAGRYRSSCGKLPRKPRVGACERQ